MIRSCSRRSSAVADVAIAVVERACGEFGVRPESANLWEDMCYSGGPLISPGIFERVMVPHYRRIVDALHKYESTSSTSTVTER